MTEPTHLKSGFAVLVGRTNVGKSTLLNALVGTKIAIVTPKPQTTRDTYHGILTRPEGQIVFVDTPGIFKTQPSKLVSNLHHKVRDALEGIDVLLHVVDPSRNIGVEDDRVSDIVAHSPQPRILVLNKLDLQNRPYRQSWLERAKPLPVAEASASDQPDRTLRRGYNAVVEVSAVNETNINLLITTIFRFLSVGPAHYPAGQTSNVTSEFWIAELIREKLYLKTEDEVPYTATVKVEKVEDRTSNSGTPVVYIKAVILTIDDRHQRMLIGQGARKIRDIGSFARKELEVAMNKKVYLDLDVLIDHEWMDRLA
ncbi:MAG: GTPase Era [Verrucomicrobiota bacterium]